MGSALYWSGSGPRRKPGRLLLLIGILAAAPIGLVVVGSIYLRHVPFEIPTDLRAPAALPSAAGLRLRYLGVSGYEISDGVTTLLLDPVITRPTILGLVSGPLEPLTEEAQISFPRADFILVNHGHYDHAIDAPAVALTTGATIVGSLSVCNLALSRGVPPEQVRVVKAGDQLQLGSFAVEVNATSHSPVLGIENPMAGTVAPDAGSLWFWQYTQDASLTFRLDAADTTILFHPSSSLAPDTEAKKVGTVIFGMSGLALTADTAARLVQILHPERVLPTHYDNFFQPRELGLALLPMIDIPAIRAAFAAGAPGVPWHLLDYEQEVTLPPDSPGSD